MTQPADYLSSFVQLSYYFDVVPKSVDSNQAVLSKTLGVTESKEIRVSKSLIETNGLHLTSNHTEQLSPTQLAAKFSQVPRQKLLAVCFRKKDGTERVIAGYKVSDEFTALGYSQVIDLQADPKNNFRLVDHRNILWFVEAGHLNQVITLFWAKEG